MWFGQPNSTITIGLSGMAAFHCVAISAPIAKRNTCLVAAGGRDAGVSQRAEERGHDDALIEGREHAGFRCSASQMCSVAASMPCATIWSTFWVMTARVGLAVEHEHISAVFLLGVLLRLGSLRLVEYVAQVRYKERDLLHGLRRRCLSGGWSLNVGAELVFSHFAASAPGIVQKEML